MTHRKQATGSPSTYLSLQQKPCKVLVAVNAFRKVHLHSREWPAHAVWRMGTCYEGPMLDPSSQAHQRSRRARVTSSGTYPKSGHGCRWPDTKEVIPTYRTHWPGGKVPVQTLDSKWGLAPPGVLQTGNRKAAGTGSTGFPR